MLNNIITLKKNQWLQSKDCSVIELINYIKNTGKLRDTQQQAIETYLFLKIQGENKPLWQLFSEGFFNTGTDLAQYNVLYPIATNFLIQHKPAYALFDFASYANLTTLIQLILKQHQALDYDSIIKNLFYNVNYPDYLMSLPMGAGKTYLMAAFMYLDLYFANNEPDNKSFAHNFLVLIPSGLKSSIIPSLRTIEHFLIGELNINPDEILEYHGGNKQYSLPKENELEFRSLNLPHSKKRYILLVQVGKEGWDCPSLTGVILSQKGDSPQNMVLQTACRCLRQVDKDSEETALIWLNQDNADTLNKQLKQEQNTSIEELNKAKHSNNEPEKIARTSRIEHLKLPPIDFYQLKITYQAVESEPDSNTKDKLNQLLATLNTYKTDGIITTRNLYNWDDSTIKILNETGNQLASYSQWLFSISRASFGTLTIKQLQQFDNQLKPLFERVTYSENGQQFFNDFYDLYHIESLIRASFTIKRELKTDSDIIPRSANLLLVEKLTAVAKNDKLYPNENDCNKIIDFDNSNASLDIDTTEIQRSYDIMKQTMEAQGLAGFLPPFSGYKAGFDIPAVIKQKDHSFHYLPYDFKVSLLEFECLNTALSLDEFKHKNLEIYYNGERGLTEFVINCFTQKNGHWKNIGNYTPDFLVIQRNTENKIHKVLIIETKGKVYADDFKPRKEFMETQFLAMNNEQYGYARFDFLYLEDTANPAILHNKINQFFS
jgi:type III restriction enzyme